MLGVYIYIILFLLLSYIIGSIPFAYILVKLVKHQDIREYGSGNPGATNAGRILGKWGFALVFILDFLKGAVPTYVAVKYFTGMPLMPLLTALCVILGHTYTIFLKFKGGKGVATAAGAFLALSPLSLAIALAAFLISFLITRIVSISSIIASVALFISILIIESNIYLQVLTGVLMVFIIFKHRSNIVRLMHGEEKAFRK